MAESGSPDPALSFEDQEDEVPALVYGPGPRVITYHGDYYPLSPVPAKRRMSKYPRPRFAFTITSLSRTTSNFNYYVLVKIIIFIFNGK